MGCAELLEVTEITPHFFSHKILTTTRLSAMLLTSPIELLLFQFSLYVHKSPEALSIYLFI